MAEKIIQNIKNRLTHSEFRLRLLRGGGISMIIQLGFAALSFVTATILARFLGSHSYGAYTNAQAWTGVLIPIAVMGFSSLLIRDTAIFKEKQDWGLLRGLIQFSDRFVGFVSIILIFLILIVTYFIYSIPELNEMRQVLWIGLLLVPIEALLLLRQGTIRGLEHVARSLLPDQSIRPTLLLLGVVALFLVHPKYLSAASAMMISLAAALISLLISSHWQRKLMPYEVTTAAPVYKKNEWLKTTFPMMLSASLNLVLFQASPIMLGIMVGPAAVGLYSAAYKIAYLIIFIPLAVTYVVAPMVARLHANGEKEKLQKLLTSSTRIAFISGLLVAMAFALGGYFLLSLFGEEFTAARNTLLILLIGNLLYIALGLSTTVLNMTGHQNMVAVIYGVSSVVNIVLNFILIPLFGYFGAAVASSISLFLCQLTLMIYTWIKLHVNPALF